MSSVAYGCERRVNFKHFDFSVFGKHVFFFQSCIFYLDFPWIFQVDVDFRRFPGDAWARKRRADSQMLHDAPAVVLTLR